MSPTASSRRNFVFGIAKSIATLAVANTGVYMVGSAFKNLDGSMVAGAKACECLCWYQNFSCGYSGPNTMAESCIAFTGTTCSSLNCSGQKTVTGCIPQ